MPQFSELYSTLLDRELGSLDTNLFTTARRKAAVNEAQQEFVRLTNCLVRQAELSLADGDDEIDLEAVIAADDFLELSKEGVALKQVSGSTTRYLTGDDLPRRLRIYAFAASLGGPRVLEAARTLAAQSGIPRRRLTLIDRSATYAHNDPNSAAPRRNAFLKRLVPFLERIAR